MSVNFPAIHIISVTKNAVNPQIRDDRDPVFHMKHVKKKSDLNPSPASFARKVQ